MKKILPLCLMAFIFYIFHLNKNYDIEENYTLIGIIISYILFSPFLIRDAYKKHKEYKVLESKVYFSKRKRELHEKELEKYSIFDGVLISIFAPLVPAFLIMPSITYHYTDYFGKNVIYTAEVYEKRKGSRGSYFITVRSDKFGREVLRNRKLYEKVSVGNKLSIMKRESFMGDYIRYGNIDIRQY